MEKSWQDMKDDTHAAFAWFGVFVSGLAIIAILFWDYLEPLFRWPK